ncbi:MAG: carbohydrate ABC transporter permease, partial [Bacteroidota bacterium]
MKRLLHYMALLVGAVIFAYPFLWMIAASLKPELEISTLALWSKNFSLESYGEVIQTIPILRALLNSLIVSLSATASVVFFGSMVGYALARLRFPGSNALYLVILFTMMIPFQIVLIPQYILMVMLGWTDTYLSLVAPTMLSAFGIILFRQFFKSVPQSLVDAARIDGCSEFGILFRVIWPLSRPVVITVA